MIRPVPKSTVVREDAWDGCLRRMHEVRCDECGRFMAEVLLVVYYDGSGTLRQRLAEADVQIQTAAAGKCLRCKAENAQILSVL